MAFGAFTLQIKGKQQDGTEEKKARLHIKPQGVDVLIDTAANEFKFPSQFANPAGVPISLPYDLTLYSNSTTGDSTTIGYEGWVADDYGRVDFQFAAPPIGNTLNLKDAVDVVVVPISSMQSYLLDAEAAADAAAASALTASSTPSHAGPRTNRYQPNLNGYNWKASNTRRLRASLGKAQAGTALAHHAFIGDSETAYFVGTGADQLNMWPLIYRRSLSARGIPVGGTGCVFTGDAGPGPLDPRWTYTGTWANNNEYRSTSTSGNTATFTSDQVGTDVNVWYYGTSGGFTVSIDGATPVSVTPTGGLTVQRYNVTGLANTTHTVKVTTSSASTVYLIAASVAAGSGLVVHNLGRYGSNASGTSTGAWLATTDATYVYKARTDCLPATPDVVWISLGVNDINTTGTSAATTASAVQTIAQRFPNSDVILVAQPQPASNANWGAYVSKLYDVADTLDIPLLDVYDRFGSTATATTNGLMGDTVHPNSAAERDWGMAAAALVPTGGDSTTASTIIDDRTQTSLNASRRRAWDTAWTPPPLQDIPVIQALPTASAIIRPTGTKVDFVRQGGVASAAADLSAGPFLVDGTPSLPAVTADPTNFVSSPLLTGGAAQAAAYAFSVTTITQPTNSAIEFMFRAGQTTHGCRIYVNGRPVTVAASSFTGLTSGNWYVLNLTFPVAATRTIKIVWREGGNGGFGVGAAYVASGQSLVRPTFTPTTRLAILGDSYEGGAGSTWPAGYTRIESGGYLASQIIGYDSVWQFGIGGTGFIASPSSNAYSTRVTDILAASPTDVIVSGSINDAGQTASAVTTAVSSLLSSLSSVPNVYVLGIQHPSVATYSGLNAAIKAGALAAGRPFIDSMSGPLGPWTTAAMLQGDGSHLTAAGQMRRGSRIAEGVMALKVP